jgi:hypothetical protein
LRFPSLDVRIADAMGIGLSRRLSEAVMVDFRAKGEAKSTVTL